MDHKYLTSTKLTALIGSASSTPKKPNNFPKNNKAKRTATGCKPIRSPTRRGVRKKPSMNWPSPYRAKTPIIAPPGPNCKRAARTAKVKPRVMPIYGITIMSAVNTPNATAPLIPMMLNPAL